MQDYLSRTVMAAALEAVGGGADEYSEKRKIDTLLTDGVRSRFERYDADGDATMDVEELGKLLIDLGEPMGRAELTEVVALVDKDGSGAVDLFEFMTWWRQVGIKNMFDLCDKDKSGSIETAELAQLFEEMGLTQYVSTKGEYEGAGEVFLEKAMQQLDPNRDGTVTFEEFLKWFCGFDAKQVFTKFDSDNSGQLDVGELNSVFGDMGLKLHPNELSEAISLLDADDSGTLDFDEFYPMYQKIAARKQQATQMETTQYLQDRNPTKRIPSPKTSNEASGIRAKLIAVAEEYGLNEDDVLLKFG